MLLGAATALADGTTATCTAPHNVFAAAGVDVVKLDCNLVNTLGALASVYVTVMNGLVIVAMLLFAFVSARHVLHALLKSHQAGTGGGDGQVKGDTTFKIVLSAVMNVLESGFVTVIILFVIINGANLMLNIAVGGGGLFSTNNSTEVDKLMGPLGPVTTAIQIWASLGAILLGAVIAAWKGIKVLQEDKTDTYTVSGGSTKEFQKIQELVKELGMIALLTVLAFIVIRFAPDFVIGLLSGTQSIIQLSQLPVIAAPS